jgi:hypothetical protein
MRHFVQLMATGGLHRLAVLNDRVHRGLIGLYTQSMLISELTQRIFMLVSLHSHSLMHCPPIHFKIAWHNGSCCDMQGDLRYKSVREMTSMSHSVITIKEHEKV